MTRLNGHALGEGGMFLAMCSFFKVPVVFISGDSTALDQVLALVPELWDRQDVEPQRGRHAEYKKGLRHRYNE